MTDRYAKIHPELQPVARKTPRIFITKYTAWFYNLLMKLIPSPAQIDEVRIENVVIRGTTDQNDIRLRLYDPADRPTPSPALLWLHGGGFVIGRPEIDDQSCAAYAREAGLLVVSVDYRLAPKHPFPAPLHDGYAALQWIVAQAEQLGIDVERLAIGGQSAGAGLAAGLVQLAVDRGEIAPALQLLVYPMLDDRTVLRAAEIDDSSNLTWNHKSNHFGWSAYLGQPAGVGNPPPYAVPARRTDLSDLPPAWIGVGTLDLFHDEDIAYAERLQRSGVPCELMVVPGAFHGFDVFDPDNAVVRPFKASQIEALRRYLKATP